MERWREQVEMTKSMIDLHKTTDNHETLGADARGVEAAEGIEAELASELVEDMLWRSRERGWWSDVLGKYPPCYGRNMDE